MKKNSTVYLPLFCAVYYALISMLYGGSIYTVLEGAEEVNVPLNWIILAGTTVLVLASIFLKKVIKNKTVCELIIAGYTALLTVYAGIVFVPSAIVFFKNSAYAFVLFVVLYMLCMATNIALHVMRAFGKEAE